MQNERPGQVNAVFSFYHYDFKSELFLIAFNADMPSSLWFGEVRLFDKKWRLYIGYLLFLRRRISLPQIEIQYCELPEY